MKNGGVFSCLIINDIDAGVGRFKETQVTVNNQTVVGATGGADTSSVAVKRSPRVAIRTIV